MIYYDAKITLNMYFHGITQTFQIQMLLLNCMMICISFSLRFCVKRFPNSSMSAKVNIGSYCKFYVCYTDWRNGVLLSGTENHKHIKNSVSARITANFNRLFEEVGFYRAGPWIVGEEKFSAPTLGQMDHNDMWLLTFHERHAQKTFSWVMKVKQRMQIQVLLCIIPNFLRKCQSAGMTWDGESWSHKSIDTNNLTICSESHPFWERNVYYICIL